VQRNSWLELVCMVSVLQKQFSRGSRLTVRSILDAVCDRLHPASPTPGMPCPCSTPNSVPLACGRACTAVASTVAVVLASPRPSAPLLPPLALHMPRCACWAPFDRSGSASAGAGECDRTLHGSCHPTEPRMPHGHVEIERNRRYLTCRGGAVLLEREKPS
jgi:hypothetical protein